jgi:cysteinyl-tRNA synthetase
MLNEIRLYNTKGKSIEDFKPIKEGKVGIYSCGPTVYWYQHLGNMRGAVFTDMVRRMFVSAGYDVTHIINITDVGHLVSDGDSGEDKMEKGAAREGKSVWEVAKFYTDAYLADLTRLNVPLNAFTFPRATDHIKEQIALVQALELAGYTYTIADGVYFDTSKFPRYGEFAHLDIEGLRSGARVEENSEKRNITDFALWKLSSKGEQRQMEWDSPWGKGFPGWHIECSAMSMKYLGEHFDVHTGGIEHIPVHHTNEIAQSECATGMIYANYWLHNNHLLDPTGKMSKSSGDFLTLSSIVAKGYDPIAYRYFLLTAHYRKELTFSYEALNAASVAYKKLWDWSAEHISHTGKISESHMKLFLGALYDDLGTPTCVASMWALLKDDAVSHEDKYATLMLMNEHLGLSLHLARKEMMTVAPNVQELLDARLKARLAKNFAEADRIRDELKKLGFSVKDTGGSGQELSN